MEKKNYTAKYFRESIPEWKWKKDPLIARLFYRRVSFYLSSYCANRGVSANSVSYFSIIIALLSCVCYFIDNHYIHIIGAVLINLWLVLDCVDGNLARSVKKQPFGEFADAVSSYLLIAFIYISMSLCVYFEGGLVFNEKNIWVVILASIATVSLLLTLLINSKFNQGMNEYHISFLGEENYKEPVRKGKMPTKIEHIRETLSIGGILPALILIATIFYAVDVIIFFVLLYNVLALMYIFCKCVKSAIKIVKEYESK